MNFEIAPKEYEIKASWYEARMYCFALNIDEKVGWRLPTKEELDEIYESENDFRKTFYLSSTEGNDSTAWNQHFTSGNQYNFNKTSSSYVRAIRDLT